MRSSEEKKHGNLDGWVGVAAFMCAARVPDLEPLFPQLPPSLPVSLFWCFEHTTSN